MKYQQSVIALALLVVAAAPATVGAVAGAGPADAAAVTLTVAVTDGFNNPIADATVTAEWDGDSTSRETASNGKVFLDVPEGADVTITVTHRAYVRNNPVVVEDAGEQEVAIKVYRKASTRVKVFDKEGKPVQDAQVLLYKRGNIADRGRTDDNGVFQSSTIEQGSYHVIAVKEGYYKNESDRYVSGEDSFPLSIREGTVILSVTVTDDHFNPEQPIAGAEVKVGSIGTVSTSGDGEQSIAVPVNSDVTITVSKDGYTGVRRDVSIGEEGKELRFTITRKDALNVTASNRRVVAGETVRLEVTDEYGEPVEGAAVLVDGSEVGTTDAQGVYQATVESAGEHTIEVRKGGVTSAALTVEGIAADGSDGDDGTATPTGNGDGDLSDVPVPGFGLPAALAAVVAAALLLRRR